MHCERWDVIFKETVHAGGGDYFGIQRGYRPLWIPDLIPFNEPITGTTLAFVANANEITAQHVQPKIKRTRALSTGTGANVLIDITNERAITRRFSGRGTRVALQNSPRT